MPNDLIPIDDDELLYRRVSVRSGWFQNGSLSADAFSPSKQDTTGISVFRKRFRTVESAAAGPSPDGYFVVVLQAGELRANGIQVEPKPDVNGVWDESHAELPQINIATKKSSTVNELKETLVKLAARRSVQGPFHHQNIGGG